MPRTFSKLFVLFSLLLYVAFGTGFLLLLLSPEDGRELPHPVAGGGRSGAAITGQHTYYVCCDCDTRGRCLVLEHKRKKNSPVRPSKGREGRKGGPCSVLLPQSPDSTSQDDTAGWGSGCGDRALVAELR